MIKKILELPLHKTVKYFGYEFEIPDKFKFMTIDKNGKIYAFANKPRLHNTIWSFGEFAIFQYIATVEYEGDWTKSLQEI